MIKVLLCFGKKPSNLVGDWKKKLDRLIDKNFLNSNKISKKNLMIVGKKLNYQKIKY